MVMKKKKPKLKQKKQAIRKLKTSNRVLIIAILLVLAIGILVGMATATLYMDKKPYNTHPKNVVIAADHTISVPENLVKFLQRQDDCKNYRGNNSSVGVGIYSVYQVSHSKFAKLSYGCSTSLSSYVMAVKNNNQWHFIPVADYFTVNGFLPKCIEVEKYQIDKSIEPFCIKENGMARDNGIK